MAEIKREPNLLPNIYPVLIDLGFKRDLAAMINHVYHWPGATTNDIVISTGLNQPTVNTLGKLPFIIRKKVPAESAKGAPTWSHTLDWDKLIYKTAKCIRYSIVFNKLKRLSEQTKSTE